MKLTAKALENRPYQREILSEPTISFSGGRMLLTCSWPREEYKSLTPRKQKRLRTLPKFLFGALQPKKCCTKWICFYGAKTKVSPFHPFTKSLVLLLWVHPCAPHVWHNEELQYSHQGRTLRQIFLLMLPCKEDISHLQSTCISSQILCYMTYCTSYPNKNSTMQNVIHCLLFPKSLPESYIPQILSGLLPSRFVVGCFSPKKSNSRSMPKLGHHWGTCLEPNQFFLTRQGIHPNPTFPQKQTEILAVKKTAEARLFLGWNSKPRYRYWR